MIHPQPAGGHELKLLLAKLIYIHLPQMEEGQSEKKVLGLMPVAPGQCTATHGPVAAEAGLRTCSLASTRDCTLDLSSLCMLVICHVSEAATSVTARGPDLSKYPDQSARGISAPLKRKLAVPKPLTSIGLCCRVKCHGRRPGYSSWPDLHCLEMMDIAGLENQCLPHDTRHDRTRACILRNTNAAWKKCHTKCGGTNWTVPQKSHPTERGTDFHEPPAAAGGHKTLCFFFLFAETGISYTSDGVVIDL